MAQQMDPNEPRDTVGMSAPHGPDMSGDHPTLVDPEFGMDHNEKEIFKYLLKPDDIYDSTGTYWADMGIMRRIKFVTAYDGKETRRELSNIWAMTKRDPFSPVGYYVRNMVIPGAGLGLEGYVLFSIGNLKPLFQQAFPDCWKHYKSCDKVWTQAVDYLEIAGIIVGQITVGILGDWLGRRWGLIQDVIIMFIGLIMLVCSWGVTQNGWVICYVWSLFFYGIGVGGEYPMTATSGMENAVGSGKISTKEDRLHRGRKVTSAFLMQGWGQFFNQVILILLLLIFHHGSGNPPYSTKTAQWTYRVSFAIPAVGTFWLIYYRVYKMKSAGKQLAIAKKKGSVTGYDTESLRLTFKYFGGRMLATGGCWYMNDIFFYGNKLFQSDFITEVTGGSKSIMPGWLYNLINVGVSLVGYYMASFFIDNKLYGRNNMMTVGFLMDFILFVIPGYHLKYYTSPDHVKAFEAMYFLSSFFNQFGPNCVTFIVAAESYPTPIRASAHGFSAACGKLGALTAAILYNYVTSQQERFHIFPWFGLAGVILTVIWLPDTTGLDLKEQERRWHYIRTGRGNEYHGIAIHPKHLSLWERWFGVGKNYNAELDYNQKIEEMRGEWELRMQQKFDEKAGHLEHEDMADDQDFDSSVSTYFEKTSKSPMIQAARNPEDEKHMNGERVE